MYICIHIGSELHGFQQTHFTSWNFHGLYCQYFVGDSRTPLLLWSIDFSLDRSFQHPFLWSIDNTSSLPVSHITQGEYHGIGDLRTAFAYGVLDQQFLKWLFFTSLPPFFWRDDFLGHQILKLVVPGMLVLSSLFVGETWHFFAKSFLVASNWKAIIFHFHPIQSPKIHPNGMNPDIWPPT